MPKSSRIIDTVHSVFDQVLDQALLPQAELKSSSLLTIVDRVLFRALLESIVTRFYYTATLVCNLIAINVDCGAEETKAEESVFVMLNGEESELIFTYVPNMKARFVYLIITHQ